MLMGIRSVRNGFFLLKTNSGCYTNNFLLEFQDNYDNPRSNNDDSDTRTSECVETHDGTINLILTVSYCPIDFVSLSLSADEMSAFGNINIDNPAEWLINNEKFVEILLKKRSSNSL